MAGTAEPGSLRRRPSVDRGRRHAHRWKLTAPWRHGCGRAPGTSAGGFFSGRATNFDGRLWYAALLWICRSNRFAGRNYWPVAPSRPLDGYGHGNGRKGDGTGTSRSDDRAYHAPTGPPARPPVPLAVAYSEA